MILHLESWFDWLSYQFDSICVFGRTIEKPFRFINNAPLESLHWKSSAIFLATSTGHRLSSTCVDSTKTGELLWAANRVASLLIACSSSLATGLNDEHVPWQKGKTGTLSETFCSILLRWQGSLLVPTKMRFFRLVWPFALQITLPQLPTPVEVQKQRRGSIDLTPRRSCSNAIGRPGRSWALESMEPSS